MDSLRAHMSHRRLGTDILAGLLALVAVMPLVSGCSAAPETTFTNGCDFPIEALVEEVHGEFLEPGFDPTEYVKSRSSHVDTYPAGHTSDVSVSNVGDGTVMVVVVGASKLQWDFFGEAVSGLSDYVATGAMCLEAAS